LRRDLETQARLSLEQQSQTSVGQQLTDFYDDITRSVRRHASKS